MTERYVEHSATSGHLDIRPYYRFSAADRCPHRFAKHRVNARTAMLHLASNPDDRTLPLLQWVRPVRSSPVPVVIQPLNKAVPSREVLPNPG